MENLGREHGEFAIFNKFAQVEETALGGFGDGLDEGNDGIDNGAFKFESTFFAEKVGEESNEDAMFGRVGEAEALEGTHNGDFVLVRNFG